MFRHMTDLAKALVFYLIAFGLAMLVALLTDLIGPSAGFVTMFAPLIAVLIMLLVVTRDGYSKDAWRALGLHRSLAELPTTFLFTMLFIGLGEEPAWRGGIARIE